MVDMEKLRNTLKSTLEKKNLNITDEYNCKVSNEILTNSLAFQIYLMLVKEEEK